MDIDALLSPEENSSAPPPANDIPDQDVARSVAHSPPQKSRARPAFGRGKRTASALSQELRRSPEPSPTSDPTSLQGAPSGVRQTAFSTQPHVAPNFRPLPTTSYPTSESAESSRGQTQYACEPPPRPSVAHRPSSTPQMETLADLASMQQRQQTIRTLSANNVRGELEEQQRSIHSPLGNTAPFIPRTISRQSLADITMAEAPAQTPPPRDFTSKALSDVESKAVTELLNYLSENSYAYDYHVELISLLHKGFLAHVYPPAVSDEPVPRGDPYSYALLTELRQARDAMDTRFAVGEEIWLDWLSDEVLLARSSEERVNVTELFQKATSDEPASVKLWAAFADWVFANYTACHDLERSDDRKWSAEDKEVCKELFSHAWVVSVLEQAVHATQWRIDESHVVWNRYAKLVQEGIPENPSEADAQRIHYLFMQRLQTPHLAHEDTMQQYWPIISRSEGNNWENAIAHVNRAAESAKLHANLRGEHEVKLQRAVESGHKENVRREMEKYLKSEKFHHKKTGPFDYNLRFALFERAVLMFPTATDWWLDFVDFAVTADPAASHSLLPLIERATRHCPWSGDLWARRILRADVERKSREEIENTKHRATNAGLLDAGGMEELVKMLQQWCSFLRRHAFNPNASEDDVDTAEVGITTALEDVQQAGRKLYGETFQGDPLFRLEQIQIKFYSEARRFDDARGIYRQLVAHKADSSEFWAQYYTWELWLWGYDRIRETRRIETDGNGPDKATAVAQEALSQRKLDWPEKVLEMYLAHFQQHESGTRLQRALADARDFSNRLASQRAKEAEEASAQAAQQQEELLAATQSSASTTATAGEKRKRDEEHRANGDSYKRVKPDESVTNGSRTEPSASTSAQIKRDREHNTITVRNLPLDVGGDALKKFFRDCGQILSINVLQDKAASASSATVEFETSDDVLAAMTRDGKEIEGREVHIQRGSQSTLYVANYPAEYDETRIRDLFKSYGEIVSIRLPSLKYNSRRRFCYVQFLTADMAKAAEAAMDGKKLDGQHTLLAKISNPEAKKDRSGPQADGREVIAKNLDREAGEEEVMKFFSQYGYLENMNLLRLPNNKLTGTGFFVYSSADEANAAVEGANNKPFHDRILNVSISDPKGRAAPQERARKEDINIPNKATSASPGSSARRESDVSLTNASSIETTGTAHARKIAIFDLPDTVNDARIRTAMEQYGKLVKIQLRRDKGAAIVEFSDVKSAFNVRQGVDVTNLGSDASTGDVADLLSKVKKAKGKNGVGASSSTNSALAFVPPSTSRANGGGRGARRGGLGFKKGGFGRTADASSNAEGSKKSNADFRSMLEASKQQKAPSAE